MKLTQEAVDHLLHVIAEFDRERGIPHNYHDLEKRLKAMVFQMDDNDIKVDNG